MRLCVLPVSGGAFPIQIGLMAELASIGIRPDLVMGSSGGNVAGYVGLAADWNPYAMERIGGMLSSKLFARSWLPWPLNVLPSMMMGYFLGTVYRAGEGTLDLFRTIFTPQTIGGTEIWTGTLNRTTGRPQFFCNRHQDQSCFTPSTFDTRLLNCMPLTFLDSNLATISKVCLASASIPILVPEQVIDNAYHTDGGTAFASPLTALHRQVTTAAGQNPLHIDYINSYDMDTNRPNGRFYRNLYEHGSLTASELIRSLCLLDRSVALDLLQYSAPNTTGDASASSGADAIRCLSVDDLTRSQLIDIEKYRSKFHRSVLELFPLTVDKVDLTTFDAADITAIITETRRMYRCRLWVSGAASSDNLVTIPASIRPWFVT
jgi:predicted acylesterase/phospholipase RssA